MEWWRKARDPVARFGNWVESNGWWSAEAESELRSSVRKQVKFYFASKSNSKYGYNSKFAFSENNENNPPWRFVRV